MPQKSSRPEPRWIGTLLYVPSLYGLGWLLARPLGLVAPGLRPDQVNLAGAVLALLLLVLTLPRRIRWVWGKATPWRELGVRTSPLAMAAAFCGGLLMAGFLLALVACGLMAFGVAQVKGHLDGGEILNALALTAGVGFAEELVFRGWLWGELQQRLRSDSALLVQALVFALVHPWARVGGWSAWTLLGGLILLGVVLALRRRADGGLLWGAVGLHGGLVGGWFTLQAGILEVSAGAPAWLVGPGGHAPNPIGGLLGWVGLGIVLLALKRHWSWR